MSQKHPGVQVDTAVHPPLGEYGADPGESYAQPSSGRGKVSLACLRASQWLLVAVVLILPVDFYFQIPGRGQGFFASEVIGAEAFAVFLLGVVSARLFRIHLRGVPGWRELWPMGLLLLSAVVSFAVAHHKSDAIRDVGKTGFFFALYVLARSASQDTRFRTYARRALLAGFVLVAISGVYLSFPHVPDLPGALLNIQRDQATLVGSSAPRQAATFRFPVEFDEYLLIMLPILAILIVQVRSQRGKEVMALLCGVGVALLVGTYTRTGLLICVAMFPVLLFLLGRRLFAIVCLCGGVVALLGLAVIDPHVASRLLAISTVSSNTSGVTEGRTQIWTWALQIFIHHPLFGVGPRNLQFQPGIYINPSTGLPDTTTENSYIGILAEQGILGGIALLCVIVGAFKRLAPWLRATVRRPEQRHERQWAVAAFVALCAMLLDATVHPPYGSAEVMGVLVVLIALVPRYDGASASASDEASDPNTFALATTAKLRSRMLPEGFIRPPAGSTSRPGILSGGPASPRSSTSRRVVFLANAAGMGGANRHSLNIAYELQRLGMKVLVVAPPSSTVGAEARGMGLPVREMNMGMNIGRWKGCLGTLSLLNVFTTRRSLALIRRLSDEEPTTFMCPYPREQLLTGLLSRRHPLTAVWVVHAPFRYLIHRVVVKPLWVRTSWRPYAVVAVSAGLARRLRGDGVSTPHLVTVANATQIAQQDGEPLATRQPYLIGCVTRLVREKGVQYVIAALPEILRRYPQAHLAIAGTGAYKPALHRQVRRLGLEQHVSFLGYQSDPRGFLSSLHVFVHATVDPGEVIPTAILEAASTQTPVVASRLASIPEEVIDGATGFLVEPGDIRDLARAIMAILADPERAHAFGAAGRQLVATRFSLDRAGTTFKHLLEGIETQEPPSSVEAQETRAMSAIRRRALLRGSAIVLISKVVAALATTFWTVVAARALLPNDYGNLAVAASLIDLGAFLSDIGLQSVATRELATMSEREAKRLLGSIIYLKLLLGVLGTGAILAVGFALPFGISVDRVMLVLGPSLFFSTLNTLTLVFRARSSLIWLLVVAIITSAVGLATTVVVYVNHGDVLAFAGAQLVTAGISGMVTLAIVMWRFSPSLRPDLPQIVRLCGTALPIGLSSALVIMYYRLDVPVLGLFASATQVAIYTSAYRFLDVLTLLPGSLQAIALPHISALRRRGEAEVREYCQRYFELAVMLGLFLGMLLSFAAPDLLHLLYGGIYDDATPVLQVLAWAGAATLVTNVFVPIVIVLGRSRAMVVTSAVGLVLNLGINIVFIPRYGAMAAAYATLLTEVAVILGNGLVSVRALRWRIELLVPMGALVATGICEGLVAALRGHATWAPGVAVQDWSMLPWPVAVVALALLWGLIFAPFALAQRQRTRRARQTVGLTRDGSHTTGFGKRANDTIWLVAGLVPSTIWVRLGGRRPSQGDEAEDDRDGESPYDAASAHSSQTWPPRGMTE